MLALTAALAAVAAVGAAPVTPIASPGRSAAYQHGPVLTTPSLPDGLPLIGDIVFADRAAHRVYFSDLTNAQVDAWDTRNGVFLGAIRGTFTGLRGFPASVNHLGPVGVLADDQGQVWAGNGDGSVVVGSARTLTETDSIATGGVNRADELAFDPRDDVILITNPAETTPFVTLLDARPGYHAVLARIPIPGAGQNSIEQPQFDPTTRRFLISVRSTTANPNGEIAVVDPRRHSFVTAFAIAQPCNPAGLAIGPRHDVLAGCDSAPPVILDRVRGTVEATIPNSCCSDEVWFNPSDERYYAAQAGNPGNPVVMVVNADARTFLTNLPIRDIRGNADPVFHAVSAAFEDSQVFVPQSDGIHTFVRTDD
jgi:hypothetical protein